MGLRNELKFRENNQLVVFLLHNHCGQMVLADRIADRGGCLHVWD